MSYVSRFSYDSCVMPVSPTCSFDFFHLSVGPGLGTDSGPPINMLAFSIYILNFRCKMTCFYTYIQSQGGSVILRRGPFSGPGHLWLDARPSREHVSEVCVTDLFRYSVLPRKTPRTKINFSNNFCPTFHPLRSQKINIFC